MIGADRITHGETPYGTCRSDCSTCDTYGPLNYHHVRPLRAPSRGTATWDSLPAAHGAATLFDVLCLGGMFDAGVELSGLRLGIGLALAWAAFPFTAYALESNSNDSLVAAMLIWGLVLARHPLGRGVLLGLALATKFAPAVLVPLWSRRPFPRGGGRLAASHRPTGGARPRGGADRAGCCCGRLNGVRAFWSRTVGYQLGRDSPFSIWGQYRGLRPVQFALMVVVARPPSRCRAGRAGSTCRR